VTQGPRLEEATSDDLPEILEVESGAYVDPWPLESFQGELGNAWSTLLVARDRDGGLVGHMVYWHVADELQLQNIGVHPKARRRGVGRSLVDHLIADARRLRAKTIHMEVRASNAPAIALYRSLGFREAGRRAAYYRVGQEDALLMSLSLGQGST